MRNVSRFCLQAHTLAVASYIWLSGSGHCDKCSCAAVQNEVRFLFRCQDLFVCSLRNGYSLETLPLSGRSTRSFFPFCQPFSVEAPYILQALPGQTVFDFVSQRHKLYGWTLPLHLGHYWLFSG